MEELELTYLPKYLPDGVSASPAKEMLDIYIPSTAAHSTLRIRKCGAKLEITKKQPIADGDASRQLETTIPLTEDEYSDLVQLPGKRVQKTRFYYQENGVNYEVDVFRNELAGLVLVDVEFDSLEKKSAFIPPPWILVDVTQEKFIAGGMVCGKKYSDLENKLQDLNYKRIEI